MYLTPEGDIAEVFEEVSKTSNTGLVVRAALSSGIIRVKQLSMGMAPISTAQDGSSSRISQNPKSKRANRDSGN